MGAQFWPCPLPDSETDERLLFVNARRPLVATAEMVDAVVAGAVARLYEKAFLRRMAAWLAWEAGRAWVRYDQDSGSCWRGEHAQGLSRLALRAIDAAQPGRYLWRREWAWSYYTEMHAPKVAQEGTAR